jgi:hypothetical protein
MSEPFVIRHIVRGRCGWWFSLLLNAVGFQRGVSLVLSEEEEERTNREH